MDVSAFQDPESFVHEFTLAEILELETLYKRVKEHSLSREFCQEIAASFSSSSNRAGKSFIIWQQVQDWFLNKHNKMQAKVNPSPKSLDIVVDFSAITLSSAIRESPSKPKGLVMDLSELAFEAKSSKDGAWYDVAAFLSYRVANFGEVEVRVRYVGYSNGDDEWLNVKRAVRERSIPLIPSECHLMKVGDLVLCFQEKEYHAVYLDALVLDIRRKPHDERVCSCVFCVRYFDDNTQEQVSLDKLCRRPSQDEPLPKPEYEEVSVINPLETLWG